MIFWKKYFGSQCVEQIHVLEDFSLQEICKKAVALMQNEMMGQITGVVMGIEEVEGFKRVY